MNDFRIGPFVPDDAEDITACYRELYGDDFPMRYVYDPEKIIERFDGENHLALVARTADSAFAGIGSLFRVGRNPRLYEIGQFIVRRPFRKHGLSTIFMERILNEFSRQVSAQAVLGQCLCNHPYSQRLCLGHGFVPTGLELEWLPPGLRSMRCSDFPERLGERLAEYLHHRPLHQANPYPIGEAEA